MAVFGSSPDVIDASVSSVCSALHIPYLSTGGLGTNVAPSNGQFVVRVGPQARDLVNAVEKLVKKLEWTEVAYIVHRKTGTRPVSRFRIERYCDFAARIKRWSEKRERLAECVYANLLGNDAIATFFPGL